MKVDVYYNLHKHTFSIRSRESEGYGCIVGHSDNVVIISPEFVVRQAGREKVLRTKQKNVHAFVRGHVLEDYAPFSSSFTEDGETYLTSPIAKKKEYTIPSGKKDIAKYNPYKYTHFVNSKEERVYNADMAIMTNNNNIPHIELYNARTIHKHKGV
jgi:hypothetical protein